MDLNYIQKQYGNFNSQLLGSKITITATVNIEGTEISAGGFYSGMDDDLDGRYGPAMQVTYPLGLQDSYRLNIVPLDAGSLSLSFADEMQRRSSGLHSPENRWVSCKHQDVMVAEKNILDYAKNITIQDINYVIKGITKESFGAVPIVHIYLVKESVDG